MYKKKPKQKKPKFWKSKFSNISVQLTKEIFNKYKNTSFFGVKGRKKNKIIIIIIIIKENKNVGEIRAVHRKPYN